VEDEMVLSKDLEGTMAVLTNLSTTTQQLMDFREYSCVGTNSK
jgi:hypothetical protein